MGIGQYRVYFDPLLHGMQQEFHNVVNDNGHLSVFILGLKLKKKYQVSRAMKRKALPL